MGGLPRVGIIFTGGTIDSVGKDHLDLAWYYETHNRLATKEILARIPELDTMAQIDPVSFRRLPSHQLPDKDWLDLLRIIHETFDKGRTDGTVITHGTNSMEETAYFLNLTKEQAKKQAIYAER